MLVSTQPHQYISPVLTEQSAKNACKDKNKRREDEKYGKKKNTLEKRKKDRKRKTKTKKKEGKKKKETTGIKWRFRIFFSRRDKTRAAKSGRAKRVPDTYHIS